MLRATTLPDGRVAVDRGDGVGPVVPLAQLDATAKRVRATWTGPLAPLARAEGVPLAWALAFVTRESGGNPSLVSPGGDVGLMQVRPATAGLPAAALLDWETNARAGLHLLGESRRLGYALPEAASRYNAGAAAGGAPHRSTRSPWGMRETPGYISAVVGLANAFAAGAPPASGLAAPACLAALRSADLAWPSRLRASDGIVGDAAHQKHKSDHNEGNAVDVTHDPSGCRGELIARLALADARTRYVIWNRRINARDGRGWRPYTGANPHVTHVHISIHTAARADGRRWPWAPSSPPSSAPRGGALPVLLGLLVLYHRKFL